MGAVKVTINVGEIDDVIQSFDLIKLQRSITVAAGPFVDLTKTTPAAATLLSPTAGPYNVNNKTLLLTLDSNPQTSLTFIGTDPITSDDVATAIITAVGESIAVDEAGSVRLTSNLTGTASKIQIDSGTALTALGWTAGDRDHGEDAHVPLQANIELYDYIDNDGEGTFFYRAIFLNSTNLLESLPGDAFLGDPGTMVGQSNLSKATVDLVDSSGIALESQEISFYSRHELLVVDGFQVGLLRGPQSIITDNTGHAEILLVRGAKVKVVFEGTSLIRDITVPNAAEFDLLALMGSAPDQFTIQQSTFPTAIRRST